MSVDDELLLCSMRKRKRRRPLLPSWPWALQVPRVSEPATGPAFATLYKWRRNPLDYVFAYRKRIPLLLETEICFHFSEGVFPGSALFVFLANGLFVSIFLQIGPWQKNSYIFSTTTQNEVIPKPTSSFRRARSVGHIFTMF